MFRKDYRKKYNSLVLSSNDKEEILTLINNIFEKRFEVNNENDLELLEYGLFAFNDFYRFISGEGDSADIFSDEIPNPYVLTTDFKIFCGNVDDIIESESKELIKKIKNILNESQFETLYNILKELYVVRKNIFVDNVYMKHNYLLGSLKAKQSILKSFEDLF